MYIFFYPLQKLCLWKNHAHLPLLVSLLAPHQWVTSLRFKSLFEWCITFALCHASHNGGRKECDISQGGPGIWMTFNGSTHRTFLDNDHRDCRGTVEHVWRLESAWAKVVWEIIRKRLWCNCHILKCECVFAFFYVNVATSMRWWAAEKPELCRIEAWCFCGSCRTLLPKSWLLLSLKIYILSVHSWWLNLINAGFSSLVNVREGILFWTRSSQ